MQFTNGDLVLQGRFRVLELIEGGSTADVYRAEQVALGRPVAIKVLKPTAAERQGMVERFEREARVLSSVDHPAIVRVLDYGQESESPVLVMEWVEGRSLSTLLSSGAMPPEKACPLLAQLAGGLAAVHERGLVHRDLCPENVMVSTEANIVTVRLVDFGLAKLLDLDPMATMIGGQVASVAGRPPYLAPEQCAGKPISSAVDLYAFGVVAYQVLSGALPFPGPDRDAFLRQHLEAPPRPLAEAAPHLDDERELCSLVMRCLEKSPEARPSSAKALAAALAKLPRVGELTVMQSAIEPLPEPPPMPVRAKKPRLGATFLRLFVADIPAPDRGSDAPPPSGPAAVIAQLRAAVPALDRVRPWHFAAGAGVAVLAAVALAGGFRGGIAASPSFADARELLESGKPAQALRELEQSADEKAGKAGEDPERAALRAAALHRLGRHKEELALVETAAKGADWSDAVLISGMAEDFGRKDDSKRILQALPPERAEAGMLKILEEGPPERQWGALRYLDGRNALEPSRLVKLYIFALDSAQCPVRATAATRLRELGGTEAQAAIQRAKIAGQIDKPCAR